MYLFWLTWLQVNEWLLEDSTNCVINESLTSVNIRIRVIRDNDYFLIPFQAITPFVECQLNIRGMEAKEIASSLSAFLYGSCHFFWGIPSCPLISYSLLSLTTHHVIYRSFHLQWKTTPLVHTNIPLEFCHLCGGLSWKSKIDSFDWERAPAWVIKPHKYVERQCKTNAITIRTLRTNTVKHEVAR